jgi:hypothetical protein
VSGVQPWVRCATVESVALLEHHRGDFLPSGSRCAGSSDGMAELVIDDTAPIPVQVGSVGASVIIAPRGTPRSHTRVIGSGPPCPTSGISTFACIQFFARSTVALRQESRLDLCSYSAPLAAYEIGPNRYAARVVAEQDDATVTLLPGGQERQSAEAREGLIQANNPRGRVATRPQQRVGGDAMAFPSVGRFVRWLSATSSALATRPYDRGLAEAVVSGRVR